MHILIRDGVTQDTIAEIESSVVPAKDDMLVLNKVDYYINRVMWHIGTPAPEPGARLAGPVASTVLRVHLFVARAYV